MLLSSMCIYIYIHAYFCGGEGGRILLVMEMATCYNKFAV